MEPKTSAKQTNVKGLAKGLPKGKKAARHDAEGKGIVRASNRGHAGGTLVDAGSISPLARLIQLLGEEKIRFQIVGMTAAAMQGVLMGTLDTDIWVDLPERQYIRLTNLCVKLGATPLAPTLYVLPDGKLVNFLFSVNGVRGFKAEYKNAIMARFEGQAVKVLPLERILASKKAIRRDKDAIHIFHIEKFLRKKKELEKL